MSVGNIPEAGIQHTSKNEIERFYLVPLRSTGDANPGFRIEMTLIEIGRIQMCTSFTEAINCPLHYLTTCS